MRYHVKNNRLFSAQMGMISSCAQFQQWLYRESSGNAVFTYHKGWVKPGRPGTEKGSPCHRACGLWKGRGAEALLSQDAQGYPTTASHGDLRSTLACGSISVQATFFYWMLFAVCFLSIAILDVPACSTGCCLGNAMTSPNSCPPQRKVLTPGGACRASAAGREGMGSALWEC